MSKPIKPNPIEIPERDLSYLLKFKEQVLDKARCPDCGVVRSWGMPGVWSCFNKDCQTSPENFFKKQANEAHLPPIG